MANLDHVTLTSRYPVRLAGSDDVRPLHRLRRDVEDWLAGKGIQQWPRGKLTAADIATQVHRGEWHLQKQTGEGIAAAMRVLRSDPEVWGPDDTPAVYVHGLMVERGCASQGLGSVMLESAQQLGRDSGAAMCRLDCVAHNSVLRSYYRQRGFTEVGRHSYCERITTVLFEKAL